MLLRRFIGIGSVQCVRYSSRAAFLIDHGQPLEVKPFNSPQKLEEDQVEIKVKHCSLNTNDVKYLEKKMHSLPCIPGYELAGEITKVGSDVDDFKEGDRVVAIAPDRCGGLASYIVMNSEDVWSLPSELSSKDATALVVGHTTALLGFSQKRPLNEGDTVLIIAGAGGFGLAAVDVASSIFKAKVIALADTEGKASLLRERGAFAAFKNDAKHNYKEIMNATDGKGVDIIYDAVGGSILNTVIKCLKDKESGSILITYPQEDVLLTSDDNKEKVSDEVLEKLEIVSLTECRKEDADNYHSIVEQVLEFSEEGLINAHTSQSFQLEQINEAIHFIKGKLCTGKVVIDIIEKS